jgi:hypothetical protein
MTTEPAAFYDPADAIDDELPDAAGEFIDPEASDLDQLRKDLAAALVEEIVLPVPALANLGYETVHIADIDGRTIENIRKRCKTKTGVDGVKLVALLLATTNTAIRKGGKRILDTDGEPLTFKSPAMLEMQGATTAAEAVRRFYRKDGDMEAASRALLKAAGWGQDVEAIDDEDPSPGRA